MPEVFISYPEDDDSLAQWANWVHSHVAADGIDVVLAPLSGEWSDEVLEGLKSSPWAVCLLTRKTVAVPEIKNGIELALNMNGNLLPVLCDVESPDVPAWLAEHSAIGFRDATPNNILADFKRIAEKNKVDTTVGLSIAAGLLGGLIILLSGMDADD